MDAPPPTSMIWSVKAAPERSMIRENSLFKKWGLGRIPGDPDAFGRNQRSADVRPGGATPPESGGTFSSTD